MSIENLVITPELSSTIMESIKKSSPNMKFGENMTAPLGLVTTSTGERRIATATTFKFELVLPNILRLKAIIDSFMSNLPIALSELKMEVEREMFPYDISKVYVVPEKLELVIYARFGFL